MGLLFLRAFGLRDFPVWAVRDVGTKGVAKFLGFRVGVWDGGVGNPAMSS